jgi:sulfotransferase
MDKKHYFISGLPRAGTTLLSAILNQNPRFQASISGPLARFSRTVIEQSSDQGGYRFQCPPEKRKQIIKGIFDNYYDDPSKEVFFDTNRGWNLMLPMLKDLYPYTKVIVCVRDISWILDSFEKLVRSNPYTASSMFAPEENINVYTRCSALMSENRTVGFAYMALKHALGSAERPMMLLVEYERLCKKPKETMSAIYKFIGQEEFAHDFENVEYHNDEFDSDVNLPGLHTTRKAVTWIERKMILPPDIQQSFRGAEVWRV